jgi:hypothetical protein
MDYRLKLVKVGGETRWGVYDGKKLLGKLHETYNQAVAERARVEARDPQPPAQAASR